MIGIGIAVATVAGFIVSSVYYMVFMPLEQRVSQGHAIERAKPGVVQIVSELVRTAVRATAFAWVATQAGLLSLPSALLLALVLWVAFPIVLLTGSVMWDKAPVATAVLHVGDWLIKLLLVALITALIH